MATANISRNESAGVSPAQPSPAPVSKPRLWTGRILSGLVVLSMIPGIIMGLMGAEMSRKGMAELGYSEHLGTIICLVLAACTLLYVIPRTSWLGMLLLTGYLGGATASHVRVGQPWFFPVIVGALAWTGLLLRNPAPLRLLNGAPTSLVSNTELWGGRILGGFLVLFLLFDGGVKFSHGPLVVDAFNHLGWPLALAATIAVLELVCTLLYAIPRTSALGAVLLTAFLGGATAMKLRAGDQVLFAVIFGVLVWGALWLRDRRLRRLIPVVS
jgi:hypothetical protein